MSIGGKKKKRKTQRDPGAPKRNVSAYLLYQNANREEFRGQKPTFTFGQIATYTSAMYARLSNEEKQLWQARAADDKTRYETELANYAPPPGYDSKGELKVDKVPKIRRSKHRRDANAPKRCVSAYLHYQNAMRSQFKNDNYGMSFGQLSKYTAHMYKKLTDEQKREWEDIAQKDKARYEAEMVTYTPPPGHDSHGDLLVQEKPKPKRRKPRDPTAPKKVCGPYMFFASECRPRIKEERPGIGFLEMGKVIGERYRALAPEEKKRYEDMTAKDKIRFQKESELYREKNAIGI